MKAKDILLIAGFLFISVFLYAQPGDLIITPTEVHFGEVRSDESRVQLFEFYNPSPVPMEISWYVTGDDGSVNFNLVGRERSDSLFFSLLPMETRLVSMDYTPQLPGPWSNLVQVYEHISGTIYTIPVDAFNIPAFYVTPPIYNFGRIAVGYPFMTNIQIYNPNSFDMQMQMKVNYMPGDEGCISLILPGGLRPDSLITTVSSNETLFVGVQVTPSSYGAHSAGITVTPYPIPQPEEVTYVYFEGEKPVWIEIEINFGTVYINSMTSSYRELISYLNSGIDVSAYAAANPSQVSLTGQGTPGGRFKNRSDSLYFHLEPRIPYPFTINFMPDQLGAWSDTLIVYDHTNNQSYYFPMSANVVPLPTLAVNPPELNFGNVYQAYEYVRQLQVQNQTDSVLTISHYVTADDGSVNLNLVGRDRNDSLYYSVNPHETKNLDVRLILSELGPLSCMINAYVQETGELFQTPLQANGVVPLIINPPVVEFGNVPLNQIRSQIIDVHNGSDSTMTISHYVTADDGSIWLREVGRTDSLYYNLLPGQTKHIEVEFHPLTEGSWANEMIVFEHITATTFIVPMNAFVEPPLTGLFITPLEVHFGTVSIGDTLYQTFSFTNYSAATMNISHYVTGDDGSVNFNLVGRDRSDSLYFPLLPNETKQVLMTVYARALGPWSRTIHAGYDGSRDWFDIITDFLGQPDFDIIPSIIDFGEVVVQSVNEKVVKIQPRRTIEPQFEYRATWVTEPGSEEYMRMFFGERTDSLYAAFLCNDTLEVIVQLTPQTTGPLSSQIICTELNSGAVFYLPVMAYVLPPPLLITPMEVHFGTVELCDTLTQSFSFTNNSLSPMNISHYVTGDDGSVNLNLIGRNRADSLFFTLLPSQTQQVMMTAIPHTLGPWSCSMHASNGSSRDWFDFIIDALVFPKIKFTPSVIDFGDCAQGVTLNGSSSVEPDSACGDHVVTFEWSVQPLIPDDQVDLDEEEDDRADTLHVFQNSNDTLNITIHFTPQNPGLWSNQLQFTELTSGAVYYVPMTAFVLPAPPLVITPLEVHFGNVYMDEVRTQQFDFTNNGPIPLQISHYVTGDDGSVNLNLIGRDRADSLFFSILPAQTRSVLMTFTPQTPGPWSADMHAYDHINGTMYNFTVDSNDLPVIFISVPAETLIVNAGVQFDTYCDVINPNQFSLEITANIEHDDYYSHIYFTGLERPDSITVTIPIVGSVRLPISIIPYRPGNTTPVIIVKSTLYENVEIKPIRFEIMSIRPDLEIDLAGGNVMLNWQPIPAAISYKIYSCDEPDGDFTRFETVLTPPVLLPSFGLPRQFYKVTAVYPE